MNKEVLENFRVFTGWGGGKFSEHICAFLFIRDLSNVITFSQIHLNGEKLLEINAFVKLFCH
jgi:hypothetical protein